MKSNILAVVLKKPDGIRGLTQGLQKFMLAANWFGKRGKMLSILRGLA